MHLLRVLSSTLLVASVFSATPAGATERWTWPVGRAGLGRTFDPPATDFGAGHRGIDIAAPAGALVRAVAPGTVAFVGRIGSIEVVTVDHGVERSTYQPVHAGVHPGDAVHRGQVLGTLQPGPSHCAGACLHLGRVRGDDAYGDPLDLLGGGRFRLISPDGRPPAPPVGARGVLRRPVVGAISSPYGQRRHPITGVRKMHDGTDFAAPCGTAVRAAAAGLVTTTPSDRAYGRRVVIDHRGGMVTGYAHLSSQSVAPGIRVRAGQIIGRVGATGLATGCHLHFMVLRGGRPVNPTQLL
ncbi:MAG: peptidoglycan DD-metalloendopeptidase family protein [Aeromicrobium sp.]